MWKETCLRRPKPFSRRRFLFDRPEHPPASSLPPELCWDMLLHHRSFFSVTDLSDFAAHLLCAPLSSTDYFQNLPRLLSENQRSDGTWEGNSLHLRILGTGLGWCHLRHCFSGWAQDHIQECIWNSPRPGAHVDRLWSSSRVYISTHQCLPQDLSHITVGLHQAQQSQQPLAIGGAGKFLSKLAEDFCLEWKTSYANSTIQNNFFSTVNSEIAHCVMASRHWL